MKMKNWVIGIVGFIIMSVLTVKVFLPAVSANFSTQAEVFFNLGKDGNKEANKVGNYSDGKALSEKILEDIDVDPENMDEIDYNMENAVSDVYDKFTEDLPFIDKLNNWVHKYLLNDASE